MVSYPRGVGVIRPYAAPGAGYGDFNAVAWCVTRLQGWRGRSADDGRGQRLKEFARTAEGSAAAHAGGIKPPGQQRVLGDHGLDLRSIVRVQFVAQEVQFALLGLDGGQAGSIEICSVPDLGRLCRPVRNHRAQHVLGDFEADASGECCGLGASIGVVQVHLTASEEREPLLRGRCCCNEPCARSSHRQSE